MATKQPTKRERALMRQYDENPHLLTQAEIMKRLKIKDRHTFYRLFTRCRITDRLKALRDAE